MNTADRKALTKKRDKARVEAEKLYRRGQMDEAFPVAQRYHRLCSMVGYPADV